MSPMECACDKVCQTPPCLKKWPHFAGSLNSYPNNPARQDASLRLAPETKQSPHRGSIPRSALHHHFGSATQWIRACSLVRVCRLMVQGIPIAGLRYRASRPSFPRLTASLHASLAPGFSPNVVSRFAIQNEPLSLTPLPAL